MKRVLLLAGLLGVLSSPRLVSASPPAPCPPSTGEHLELFPDLAMADGIQLARSPSTGRFVTDAGLEFEMELANVQAELTDSVPGCEQPSGLLGLDIIDPFTNQQTHLTVEVRP